MQALEAAVAFSSDPTTLLLPPISELQEPTISAPSQLLSEPGWSTTHTLQSKTGSSPDPFTLGKNQTPLHVAARTGNEVIARALLDNGADVDGQDIAFKTALHIA